MIFYEDRNTAGKQEKNNNSKTGKRNRPAKIVRCFYFSWAIFRMLRHDHGKLWRIKKRKTRGPFDENENITRRLRRPSFCHRIASRKKKKEILPFPLRCAWVSMAVFMKLSAWKSMPPLVSLDSMPTLGQGSSWKSQKIPTSGGPFKTLQRLRERKHYQSLIGLSKHKQILPPKTGAHPLFWKTLGDWEIPALQKKKANDKYQ